MVKHWLIKLCIKLLLKFKACEALAEFLCFIGNRGQLHGRHSNVLVFNSGGGGDDILSAQSLISLRINYLDYWIPQIVFYYFIPEKCTDYTYSEVVTRFPSEFENYQKFLEKVLFHLKKNGLNLIIGFNFVYYAQRIIPKICSNLDIKYVVYLKECYRTDVSWRAYSKAVESDQLMFFCKYIWVHNEDSRNRLSEIKKLEFSTISVIGQARSSILVNTGPIFSEARQCKRTIVFYLVNEVSGLNYVDEKQISIDQHFLEGLRWNSINETIIHCAHSIAESGCKVIVKSKSNGYYTVAKGLLSHRNIKFVAGDTNYELLHTADVVAGFNSTALVEAVAAGVPAIEIVPQEVRSIALPEGIRFDNMGCVWAISERDLVESSMHGLLHDLLEAPACALGARTKLIQSVLFNEDGKAANRLARELVRGANSG